MRFSGASSPNRLIVDGVIYIYMPKSLTTHAVLTEAYICVSFSGASSPSTLTVGGEFYIYPGLTPGST